MTFIHGALIGMTIFIVLGLIVYVVKSRRENKDYNRWLDGYLAAEKQIELNHRSRVLQYYWALEQGYKDRNDSNNPYLKGYIDCLLDKGIIR